MAEERKCSETGCDGNCGSCSKAGSSKPQKEALNKNSSVKKVIGVVSGKGGVGKSLVTSMLSVLMTRKGYKTAILDADITGPSIPKMFGVHTRAEADEDGIFPATTLSGLKLMSVNLLLEDEEAPVVWRGPVIAGAVTQFWTDVNWGEVDYMFVDMPPGTGDVPLTVFQSLPVDGIVIVTSPQDLVSMIVKKAYNMANALDVPVLGIVENMSYVCCPDCGAEFRIFGEGKTETVADELGVKLLAQVPIDVRLAELADLGKFEYFSAEYMNSAADIIEEIFKDK
ncbi:MAG: Mrp/NBP35 family ATP-binding protein [Ruminococcaceae bacterium]|nr:Mrp/NBP35 family ATP-binding protein [Oscillospiraceae bacterium]